MNTAVKRHNFILLSVLLFTACGESMQKRQGEIGSSDANPNERVPPNEGHPPGHPGSELPPPLNPPGDKPGDLPLMEQFMTRSAATHHGVGNEVLASPAYGYIRTSFRSKNTQAGESFFSDFLFELSQQALDKEGLVLFSAGSNEWVKFDHDVLASNTDCSKATASLDQNFRKSYLDQDRGFNSSLAYLLIRLNSYGVLNSQNKAIAGAEQAETLESLLMCASSLEAEGPLDQALKAAIGYQLMNSSRSQTEWVSTIKASTYYEALKKSFKDFNI